MNENVELRRSEAKVLWQLHLSIENIGTPGKGIRESHLTTTNADKILKADENCHIVANSIGYVVRFPIWNSQGS